jgi:hypothetical protein
MFPTPSTKSSSHRRAQQPALAKPLLRHRLGTSGVQMSASSMSIMVNVPAPPGAGEDPLRPSQLLQTQAPSPLKIYDVVRSGTLSAFASLSSDRGVEPIYSAAAAFLAYGCHRKRDIYGINEAPVQRSWPKDFLDLLVELNEGHSLPEVEHSLSHFISQSRSNLMDAVSFFILVIFVISSMYLFLFPSTRLQSIQMSVTRRLSSSQFLHPSPHTRPLNLSTCSLMFMPLVAFLHA